jgi:hypothetical protein
VLIFVLGFPQDMLDSIRLVVEDLKGKPITVTAIVDIMNQIGRCVVAGNVRRTAEIGTLFFCS